VHNFAGGPGLNVAQVLDVAIGMEHLHSQKFIHGDLKAVRVSVCVAPLRALIGIQINLLVTRSGRAVIAGFGQSSTFMDSEIPALSSTVQQSGGTLRWQAPELLKGNPNTVESDVYAFAGVCYEVCSTIQLSANCHKTYIPADIDWEYPIF
jgi:serine/threonine protein kinase